ncbi:MAG: DUF5947 family protein [Gemmatimonadota bacterium]
MENASPHRAIASPRLRRLVKASRARESTAASGARTEAGAAAPGLVAPARPAEGCELSGEPAPSRVHAPDPCAFCGESIADRHRHIVDLGARSLLCVCRACALLFDRDGAGGDRYRLVSGRLRRIEDLELDDVAWASLRIPVDLAFFFESAAAGRVAAFYPGPMGATESGLELRAWNAIASANPVLREMEPDVEALLVNRVRGARESWLAPIDVCYRLVGVVATHWRGIGGGDEVWSEIGRFLEALRRRAEPVPRTGARRREEGDDGGA